MADAGSAAFRVSGLELGGLFGSLLAGRISDSLIASRPKGGNVGKRVQARRPGGVHGVAACSAWRRRWLHIMKRAWLRVVNVSLPAWGQRR